MSDAGWNRAHELAERTGRLTYFVEELVALATVRHDVPADFLRERLELLAEQATSNDLVTQTDVGQRVTYLREQVKFWRERRGMRRKP